MRLIKSLMLIFAVIVITCNLVQSAFAASSSSEPVYGATNVTVPNLSSQTASQVFDTNAFIMQKIQDQLAEVRRDQLNYKVEKDILEKTYTTNTQTVTTIVSLIFGVFGILAFFGLKDLTSLKDEFKAELEKVRGARAEYDSAKKELLEKQRIVESDYKKLYEQNQQQDKKLKALEFREKIAKIMHERNFPWALENLAVALSIEPDNVGLLSQKMFSLWEMGDLANALLTAKRILEIDPRDDSTLTNCLELMLFQKDYIGFSDLLAKNSSLIQQKYGGVLSNYYRVLELYQKGLHSDLKLAIEGFVNSAPGKKTKIMEGWSFGELRSFLKGHQDSASKDRILILSELLEGESDRQETLKKLDLLPVS